MKATSLGALGLLSAVSRIADAGTSHYGSKKPRGNTGFFTAKQWQYRKRRIQLRKAGRRASRRSR